MHSQDRIFNGHAISIAQLKACCLQLLFVALSLSISTSLTGQCPPASLQCSNINHSLNPATCSGLLTVDDVIGNNLVDATCGCEVTILDDNDNIIPNDFDLSDAGETFRYQLCCSGVCCWAEVTVEFKGNAQFVCPTNNVVETSCIEMDMITPLLASDVTGTIPCVEPEIILINEIENIFDCDDGFERQLIRTFQIVSAQGPTNEICTQTINILPADLSMINQPPKATINCDQEPTPDITGAPSFTTTLLNGDVVNIPLIPGELPRDCSVFVGFEDSSVDTPCGRLIQRNWSIVQWTCDDEDVITFTQVIDVTDNIAPTIVCPTDIVTTTTTFDCKAAVTLPPAEVSDNCTNPLTISISPGNINGNGGITIFDLGNTMVSYSVTDCNMNVSTCVVNVDVVDMTPPIAICESDFTIGFAGTGITYLDAYRLDGGSFDDCSTVKFMIARMVDGLPTQDHMFQDRIEILCEDAEMPFPVLLKAEDGNGNVNFCWVLITVENNLIPSLVCPPDITVACDTVFDVNSLDLFFGEIVTLGDSCLSGFTIQDVLLDADALNTCGVGERRRRIRIFNANGMRVSNQCFQNITFAAPDPFVIERSDFPADICDPVNVCMLEDIVNISGVEDFDFEFEVDMMPCQLIGISTDLEEVTEPFLICGSLPSVDICQQFVRTFTVVNWCAFDGEMGSKSDPFVFEQIININETTPPELEVPLDMDFCLPINDCDELFVQLVAPEVLQNNCEGDLTITNEIISIGGPDFPEVEGEFINVNLPIGTYQINWTATDACGNFDTETQTIVVMNCKAPTITCATGIVLPILPADTNGDGMTDINQAVLEIKHVLIFAGNACDVASDPMISFDDTNLQESVIFSCADALLGEPISVDLFATDLDGNQSNCTTTIALSTSGLCLQMPTSQNLLSVSGNIRTSSNTNIDGVDVILQGSTEDVSTITSEGLYAFNNMPSGGSYVIKPQKEDDYLLGVSISDMILIQQHILAIKEIDDPYTLLAADVNQDGKVSITDLIMLQRAVLGLVDKPADDESWLFVNAESTFFDPTNPLGDNPPTLGFVSSLSEDEVQDFVGIKYGDINGDALSNTENRSQWDLFLETNDMTFDEDKVYSIPFYLSDQITNLRGLNVELTVSSNAKLIDIDTKQFESTTFTSDLAESKAKVIAVSSSEMIADPTIPLFTLTIRGTIGMTLSDALIGSKLTVAKLTAEELIEKDVQFRINKSVVNETVNVIPNPWYDMTTIQLTVESKTNAAIIVSDISGKVVFENDYELIKGINTIELRAETIEQSGLYVIQVNTATSQQTIKMIKLE